MRSGPPWSSLQPWIVYRPRIWLCFDARPAGAAIAAWPERALRGEGRPRMFGRNPVRWMGYLIAHESHHRGQIALALKQNDLRLPEKVALQGLWGTWMHGKDP